MLNKKLCILLFSLLLFLTACGSNNSQTEPEPEEPETEEVQEAEPEPEPVFIDITDGARFFEDNAVSSQSDIKEAKYEITPNGSYKFYLTLKGPKDYNFMVFEGGPEEPDFRSDIYTLDGSYQDFSFIISENKMSQIGDLLGNIFLDDDNRAFFNLLNVKALFTVVVNDPNDATYTYIDITEDGEADNGTLEATSVELVNYSYAKISDESTRFSVTFKSAPDMEISVADIQGNIIGSSIGKTEGEQTTVKFTISDENCAQGLQLRITGSDGTGIIDLGLNNVQ